MNDDLLTRFRKAPRSEFSAALYQRINTPMNTRRIFAFRRLTFAAALCIALIAAVAFSPTARAALQTLIREIGGVTYVGADETPAQSAPAEEVTVPEELLSLEEARAKLLFSFDLPTWAPDGFTMSALVRIAYFPNTKENNTTPFVYVSWWKSQNVGGDIPLELIVSPRVNWLVDLDHLEEVQVNGQPAGLTGGGWDADSGQWETTYGDLTLTWVRGDMMYQLRSPGVTVEELIRMAESIH